MAMFKVTGLCHSNVSASGNQSFGEAGSMLFRQNNVGADAIDKVREPDAGKSRHRILGWNEQMSLLVQNTYSNNSWGKVRLKLGLEELIIL